MKILERKIGVTQKPFIIAEMSANHDQSLETALAIVEAVAKTGADAIKLQTLKPENITLNIKTNEFFISDEDNLWHGQSLYELYQKAYLPWEWHQPIFERAKSLGMIAFSSPFDLDAVDFLESLDVPCYKIGSAENRDIPLIQKAASTKKPLIISTGMATALELAESVEAARSAGCQDLALLKCNCSYPTNPNETHLRTIPHMRDLFGCEIGLSDHSEDIGVAVASVALGASIIEKHVTLAEADDTLDSAFSLGPQNLQRLVACANQAHEALGKIHYGPTEAEERSLRYRRSLYVSQDIKMGDTISADNIKSIRPSLGLPPKFYHMILGRKAKKDLKLGEPLQWEMVE